MLVNATHVKRAALEIAAKHRPAARFSRVSRSLVDTLDRHCNEWLVGYISRLPSNGKTIMGMGRRKNDE